MVDSPITLDPAGAAPYHQPPDQPRKDLETWKKMEREIRQNSPKTPYTGNWKPVCRNLALILGHGIFRFCFLKASLVRLTRDTAVIEFGNLCKLDYVRDFRMPELRRAVRAAHPRITVIGMKVAPPLPALRQEDILYTRKNPVGATGAQNNGDFA